MTKMKKNDTDINSMKLKVWLLFLNTLQVKQQEKSFTFLYIFYPWAPQSSILTMHWIFQDKLKGNKNKYLKLHTQLIKWSVSKHHQYSVAKLHSKQYIIWLHKSNHVFCMQSCLFLWLSAIFIGLNGEITNSPFSFPTTFSIKKTEAMLWAGTLYLVLKDATSQSEFVWRILKLDF